MLHAHLLLYPFEKNLIDQAYLDQKSLIINADYVPAFDKLSNLIILQNDKDKYDGWKNKNYDVLNILKSDEKFDLIFCQMPTSKEYCFYLIALMLKNLNSEGKIICYAGNNENGKRLKKWFEVFSPENELNIQEISKEKQRIIYVTKNQSLNHQLINDYLKQYGIQHMNNDGINYQTKPGIYGWKKIDTGSKLLKTYLESIILKGYGADFGCGYGYLTYCLAQTQKQITGLDVIDSDYHAIQCARENLKESIFPINYLYQDIQKLNYSDKYDWVVMNPPFHQGKMTNTDLGLSFIKQSARSLKKNGCLYIVANISLPYEKTLQENFSSVEKITEKNGFKVFAAKK